METEAKIFVETARTAIARAEKEADFAAIAIAQANADAASPNLKLVEIAKWHTAHIIKYYGEAIVALEQAAKDELPAEHKNYIEQKMKICLEKMALANTRKLELGAILRTRKLFGAD